MFVLLFKSKYFGLLMCISLAQIRLCALCQLFERKMGFYGFFHILKITSTFMRISRILSCTLKSIGISLALVLSRCTHNRTEHFEYINRKKMECNKNENWKQNETKRKHDCNTKWSSQIAHHLMHACMHTAQLAVVSWRSSSMLNTTLYLRTD